MKKARIKMMVWIWMLMGVLVWSLPKVQVHAETQNGGEVSLPHIHAGSSAEEGGCYTVPVYHSHTGNSDTEGGCYTVPVSCGGSITAKTDSAICGSWNAWCGPGEHYDGDKWWATCSTCGTLLGPHGSEITGNHMRTETYYSCDRCGTRYG